MLFKPNGLHHDSAKVPGFEIEGILLMKWQKRSDKLYKYTVA